jgi:mannose-1-phosphate guanylyltransferase/mannose-1-phosphate guanylyltransferase/mannose-6-phosphate isomerase
MMSSIEPNRNSPIVPVILAGGAGNRLWPLSRQEFPKQLIPLLGAHSLVQQTALRFADAERFAAPLVITGEAIRFTIAEQLRQVGIAPAALVLEPMGRGTAPAVAVAALLAAELDPHAIIMVAPSDHAVRDIASLHGAVAIAAEAARRDFLVTFSIVPTHAETGYGYVERGDPVGAIDGAFRVASFVEKPIASVAESMLAGGRHFWNSGMFIFRAARFIEEMRTHAPEIVAAVEAALSNRVADLDFIRLDAAAFANSPSNSIDYAVMEKTDRAATVPLSAGWSDVGAFSELWAISEKDADGNVHRGDVVVEQSRNCLVMSDRRLTTLVGVDNLAVIVTEDAVLVSDLAKAQNVKNLVDQLKLKKRGEVQNHKVVHRPWGYYQGLHEGEGFQVKRLTVKPGGRLSLQKHAKRSEHWTVVQGVAQVTRNDEVFLLNANESTFIPLGAAHRLENCGDTEMTVIEVQCGAYLGEDDIVRLDDVYGRAPDGQAAPMIAVKQKA